MEKIVRLGLADFMPLKGKKNQKCDVDKRLSLTNKVPFLLKLE